MYTSYFAKYKGKDDVSIALKAPSFYTCSYYPDLYPTWEILNEYKRSGNKEIYIKKYNLILDKLDPKIVYEDLKGKTLLCWEKSGIFCHRRLVANWIESNIRIKVPEYDGVFNKVLNLFEPGNNEKIY